MQFEFENQHECTRSVVLYILQIVFYVIVIESIFTKFCPYLNIGCRGILEQKKKKKNPVQTGVAPYIVVQIFPKNQDTLSLFENISLVSFKVSLHSLLYCLSIHSNAHFSLLLESVFGFFLYEIYNCGCHTQFTMLTIMNFFPFF